MLLKDWFLSNIKKIQEKPLKERKKIQFIVVIIFLCLVVLGWIGFVYFLGSKEKEDWSTVAFFTQHFKDSWNNTQNERDFLKNRFNDLWELKDIILNKK